MKIVFTTAMLVLAPMFMAQAADLPKPQRPAIPSCTDLSGGAEAGGSVSQHFTATGAIPCPEFLSTTTIERKRVPQWT
jgi:hypothetical protein